MLDRLHILHDFYCRADWTRDMADYVKRERLNLDAINAHAGIIAMVACTFDGPNFSFDDNGEPSATIEAYGEDAETVIDLVAWPIDKPDRFATALGAASVLGEANVYNQATWACGNFLRIHRSPLQWLQDDCLGCVVLDHRAAPAVFSQRLGKILAEDEQHARDLKVMLCATPVEPRDILFLKPVLRRAA